MLAANLKLEGRLALLVGAGRVGRRKLEKLLAAGARVRLAEPEPDEEIRRLAEAGRLEWHERFSPAMWEGASLLFLASPDRELNRRLAEEGLARGLWVNAADAPELSNLVLPAVVERGEFRLAVSSGGSAAWTARLAERLRREYGREYGRFAELMARLRPLVLGSGWPAERRAEVFARLAASERLFEAVATGDRRAAAECLDELLAPLPWPPELLNTDHLNTDRSE